MKIEIRPVAGFDGRVFNMHGLRCMEKLEDLHPFDGSPNPEAARSRKWVRKFYRAMRKPKGKTNLPGMSAEAAREATVLAIISFL